MNENEWNESEDDLETLENYRLSRRDCKVVAAAIQLMEKIRLAAFVRPAEQVSVAKALHVLRLMPKVTSAEVTLRINLNGPRRWFGEHEIWHWWCVEICAQTVQINSGGHFYRQSTGGDTFTSFMWSAEPGEEPDYSDFLKHLQIVDDAKPFNLEVADMDLNEQGFTLEVEDQDNPFLEEMEAEEGEDEFSVYSARVAKLSLTKAEELLMAQANKEEGELRDQSFLGPPETCDICRCDLAERTFFVDGQLRGSSMFAFLCAECFLEKGEGIGWGTGQLYMRQLDGEWVMVGGFPPEET